MSIVIPATPFTLPTRLLQPNVFNIVDFGGSTSSADNSAAIQAAIDAAGNDGGTVSAPPGRYAMTAGVTVPANNKIVILDFFGSLFFVQDNAVANLFHFQNQFGQLRNINIQHFGSGQITSAYFLDNANGFFSDNVLVGGEFGTVVNCCRMVDSFDTLFLNPTFDTAAVGLLADGYNANFTSIIGGSMFACGIGFQNDTPQIQSPFFLAVVTAECTTADYQMAGAIAPTWINCDLEGTAGSPGIGKAFNFTGAIVGATIQNNFFAHRTETFQRLSGSSFKHNCFYNDNITFDNTNVDVEVQDNFVAAGSGGAGVASSAVTILTVAQLPTVASVAPGTRKLVKDATVTTRLNTVVGGGANIVPVFSNGTNWLID